MQTLPRFFQAFPPAQIQAQYAKNATQLRAMHAQAVRSGKPVNGYTAAQLDAHATRYEALARAN